jgi:hypothetical protein
MSKGIESRIVWIFSALILSIIFLFSSSVAEEEMKAEPIPIHMNFKESARFSPETSGDIERIAMEEKYSSHEQNPGGGTPVDTRNKGDWTKMGEWESDAVLFDITLSNVVFNLWWVEDPDDTDYDAALDLRWTIYLDGNEIYQFTDEEGRTCEETRDDPCEYAELPNVTFSNTDLIKGQIISLKVEMKAFQAIYIYYDNASRDSGMKVNANGVIFGNNIIKGQTISFDFIEAWPTRTDEATEGNYITLIVDGVELDNNQQEKGYPRIEDGAVYSINGTDFTSERITWFVDNEYAKMDKSIISFSYARKGSTTAEPTLINVADRLLTGTESGAEEEGILGLPGFELIIGILSLTLVSCYKREL